MAKNSNIEWTDHTFNPWIGCTKISRACDLCYAERRMDARLHRVQWGAGQPRQRTKTWRDPVKWNAAHEAFYAQHGRRQRVFCASLADVFDNEVPAEWRADLFTLIAKTPNLDWLLLTKRIGNVRKMLSDIVHSHDEGLSVLDMMEHDGGWYRNVWIGATICDQTEADRDVPKLLEVPARVRFLSIEPMLGPIDIRSHMWPVHPSWPARFNTPEEAIKAGATVTYKRQALISKAWADHLLSWVICGGESGAGARPMRAAWAQSLRDQCNAAGVPFLFKQWGEWLGEKQDGAHDHEPLVLNATDDPLRVGKKAAGRLLDGRMHNEFPGA